MSNVESSPQAAIIIQARMSSTRFPRKMLEEIRGVPLITYVVRRCERSSVRPIVVATSTDASDDPLAAACAAAGILTFRGDLHDVLSRYLAAADTFGVDTIVRVCGDTPFVDPAFVDMPVRALHEDRLAYVGGDRATAPPLFFAEAVTREALGRVAAISTDGQDHEHVTKYIVDHPDAFAARFIDHPIHPSTLPDVRLTIDFPEDIIHARAVDAALVTGWDATSAEVAAVVRSVLAVHA